MVYVLRWSLLSCTFPVIMFKPIVLSRFNLFGADWCWCHRLWEYHLCSSWLIRRTNIDFHHVICEIQMNSQSFGSWPSRIVGIYFWPSNFYFLPYMYFHFVFFNSLMMLWFFIFVVYWGILLILCELILIMSVTCVLVWWSINVWVILKYGCSNSFKSSCTALFSGRVNYCFMWCCLRKLIRWSSCFCVSLFVLLLLLFSCVCWTDLFFHTYGLSTAEVWWSFPLIHTLFPRPP